MRTSKAERRRLLYSMLVMPRQPVNTDSTAWRGEVALSIRLRSKRLAAKVSTPRGRPTFQAARQIPDFISSRDEWWEKAERGLTPELKMTGNERWAENKRKLLQKKKWGIEAKLSGKRLFNCGCWQNIIASCTKSPFLGHQVKSQPFPRWG